MTKLDDIVDSVYARAWNALAGTVPAELMKGRELDPDIAKKQLLDLFREIVNSTDVDGLCPTRVLTEKIGEL